MEKVKYLFFDANGQEMSCKHNVKEFPEEWLPPKNRKGKGKSSSGNSGTVYVFTTNEKTPKASKFMTLKDWELVRVGQEFWLPSGEHMMVAAKDKIDRDQKAMWGVIFSNDNGVRKNYKQCGRAFLIDLTEDQKEKFLLLPIDEQIAYLNVPNKAQKAFKDPRWGMTSLKKYCEQVANIDDARRAKAEELKRIDQAKMERLLRKNLKIQAALDYDDTRIPAEIPKSRPILGYDFDYSWSAADSCSAADYLLDQAVIPRKIILTRIEEKVTGNDLSKVYKLLERLSIAFQNGIINRDILHLIADFYEWRFHNILTIHLRK